ncbi:ATP-binding protein [Roseivivax sediminis]|uniref:AAA domain-containing protein n=1 Tax=Roseivivax sediminis TaxID=936889 RepID=A0A1I1S6E1_9RHOB|nr:ATP-binding protein [Roseivivax sediminis]SFD42134.1 AAA domain-containing protein [Roseivivax sediminis]
MSSFLNETVAQAANANNGLHYPFDRGSTLRKSFSDLLSRHVGRLRGSARFEAEILVVTGLSGTGKTREITKMLDEFNGNALPLPDGKPARVVHCLLDRKGGWKDLGRKTLKAMGYSLSERARLTQSEIWERVAFQARAQGIIGIYYDEAQHIFAGKSDNDRETILDSFKTLLKSHDWPLMLIMSGVPELGPHVRSLDQVYSKVTYLHFENIDLPDDYEVVHEIVGSYALKNGLAIDDEIVSHEFYHRLATAAAFRWGLLINMVIETTARAVEAGCETLSWQHFTDNWVAKTQMNQIATPFTHDGYETMFRPDKPFQAAIG